MGESVTVGSPAWRPGFLFDAGNAYALTPHAQGPFFTNAIPGLKKESPGTQVSRPGLRLIGAGWRWGHAEERR